MSRTFTATDELGPPLSTVSATGGGGGNIPGSPVPRALPTGITARSVSAAKGAPLRNLIQGAISSEVTWAQLQPVDTAHIDATALARIVADLDWCWSNNGTNGDPIQVDLRIDCGQGAPAWVVTATGSISPWYVRDNGNGGSGAAAPSNSTWHVLTTGGATPLPMLQWWQTVAVTAYANLQSLLADAPITSPYASVLGNHPALACVAMTLGGNEYQEPVLHQFGVSENRAACATAGWTQVKDDASLLAGWTAHMAAWASYNVACEMPYNPSELITGSGGYQANVAVSIARMNTHLLTCGQLTVWSNHSLQYPYDKSAAYQTLYDAQKAGRAQASPFPVPIAYQTETLSKLQAADSGPAVLDVVNEAAGWGAAWVEVPSNIGLGDLSVAQATTANATFATNVLPLVGGTVIPPGGGGGGGTLPGGPDNATVAATEALHLIAGAFYGDPSGNQDANGLFTINSTSNTHLSRSTGSLSTLQQIANAAILLGGTGVISTLSTSKSKVVINLPAGTSISMDLSGHVSFTTGAGTVDAFGFGGTPTVPTTTATGPQARAFCAGFMQGEGSQSGLIGDDPSQNHLAVIQKLMLSTAGYQVATDLVGNQAGSYWHLNAHSSSQWPLIQLYPFAAYGRCPGGHP